MRRSTSGSGGSAVTTTAAVLVPYSPTRVALTLSVGSTVAVFFRYRDNTTTAGGFYLAAGASPILLNIGDHGEIVRGPFWALTAAGTGVAYYTDTHLPDPPPEVG